MSQREREREREKSNGPAIDREREAGKPLVGCFPLPKAIKQPFR